MGGANSGSWLRWNTKKTIESTNRIDIRYLHRNKLLKPGIVSSLNWTTRGKPNGNIQFSCFDKYLLLAYRYRTNSEAEWKDVRQHIQITETSCNYGGARKWFICPNCDCRVAILCSHHSRFVCRKCANLAYYVQTQGFHSRMVDKRNKAYAKIHDSNGRLKHKPKGLHWQTWSKYWRDYKDADYLANLALVSAFERVYGPINRDEL